MPTMNSEPKPRANKLKYMFDECLMHPNIVIIIKLLPCAIFIKFMVRIDMRIIYEFVCVFISCLVWLLISNARNPALSFPDFLRADEVFGEHVIE